MKHVVFIIIFALFACTDLAGEDSVGFDHNSPVNVAANQRYIPETVHLSGPLIYEEHVPPGTCILLGDRIRTSFSDLESNSPKMEKRPDVVCQSPVRWKNGLSLECAAEVREWPFHYWDRFYLFMNDDRGQWNGFFHWVKDGDDYFNCVWEFQLDQFDITYVYE